MINTVVVRIKLLKEFSRGQTAVNVITEIQYICVSNFLNTEVRLGSRGIYLS